jgi:hypothetical protein
MKLKIDSDKKIRDQDFFTFVVKLISHHLEASIEYRPGCLLAPQFPFSAGCVNVPTKT